MAHVIVEVRNGLAWRGLPSQRQESCYARALNIQKLTHLQLQKRLCSSKTYPRAWRLIFYVVFLFYSSRERCCIIFIDFSFIFHWHLFSFFTDLLLLDFWICIFTHKSQFLLLIGFSFFPFTVQLTTLKQIFHLSRCGLCFKTFFFLSSEKHLFSFATSIFHYWGWKRTRGERGSQKNEWTNESVSRSHQF